MIHQAQQQQPRVQFSDDHHITMVETVDEAEKSAIWYSKTDLAHLRKSTQAGCDCIPSSAVEEEESSDCECTSKTEKGLRKEFISSLLKQQQEHKQMGLEDPKGLFQFSRALTKKSRQQAIKKARDHEKEVKSFEEQRELIFSVVEDALELIES